MSERDSLDDLNGTDADADERFVEFGASVKDGTRTYFAEAPASLSATQSYEFESIEHSLDGVRKSCRDLRVSQKSSVSGDGNNWVEIPGTTDRNSVLGADTSL